MWQRLQGNVFWSIRTTVNLHYWKKWKYQNVFYKVNNFLFDVTKNIKPPQHHKYLKKYLLTKSYIISLIYQSLVQWILNNVSFFKLFLTHSDSNRKEFSLTIFHTAPIFHLSSHSTIYWSCLFLIWTHLNKDTLTILLLLNVNTSPSEKIK